VKIDTVVFFIIPTTERDKVGTILTRHGNSHILHGFQYSSKSFLIGNFFVPAPHVVDHSPRTPIVLAFRLPKSPSNPHSSDCAYSDNHGDKEHGEVLPKVVIACEESQPKYNKSQPADTDDYCSRDS